MITGIAAPANNRLPVALRIGAIVAIGLVIGGVFTGDRVVASGHLQV